MTMLMTGGEGGSGTITTNGSTILAASGETAVICAIGTGSSVSFSTADKVHGTQAIVLNPAANQLISIKSWALGNSIAGATDFIIKSALGAPASGITDAFGQLRSNSGNLYTISRLPSGGLRVGGATNQDYSSFTFSPAVAKRVGFAWKIDVGTPANSQYRLIVTAVDSDVLLFDSGWVTLAPTTSNVGADSMSVGRIGTNITDTSPLYIDDFRTDAASTDVIPYLGSLKSTVTIDRSGTVVPGTVVGATVTSALGNANTKTYALRTLYSAKGDFTDTTITDSSYQAAGTGLTYQVSAAGAYQFIGLTKQDPI